MADDLLVSHYRVLKSLGEGGMGEVYLGIDETLRRKVALKSILPAHRLDPATKARFLREARTLSQLDHPNICRVYDYIETADRDWIVLELVEGQTLSYLIKHQIGALDRLSIARQIAAVLVATHAAGVVHRDLKPSNVMVTGSGQVKVLDFGLSAIATSPASARAPATPTVETASAALDETRLPSGGPDPAIDVSEYRSEMGSVKGTAAYMSPEQARGELVTPASDMYSFGLVVQELFTGQRPYGDSKDYHELLEKARRGESRDPVGLPAHLATLVRRLKSLPPTQRPTAVEALDRLEWIANAPKRFQRNALIAAALVAAILGAAKYTIDLARERNAAVAARVEADQRRGQAEGLIGFMVGDLRDKLTAVGRLEIMDDVGKQALAYFASVPADTLTDAELYRRSQALHQLGQVRQARGDLPGALKAYEDSLAQATAVVARRPDNSEWQLGLGTSHFYAGDLKMRRGDLPGALAHFEAYKAIAERLVAREPANFTFRLELSYGHSNVAAIYSRQGNLIGARDELLQVVDLQAELAQQKPGDVALQTSRANTHNRLGIIQDALGDLTGAAQSFKSELDLYGQLLAADARNARLRRRREVSHIFSGVIMRALGRLDEATAHFAAALAETEELVRLDPTNADWRRDLAVAEAHLGRLELAQGRTARALSRLRAAADTFTSLARDSKTSGPPRDLAMAQVAVAQALASDGDRTGAQRLIVTATGALQSIVGRGRPESEAVRDLAIAENARGEILDEANAKDAAREAWTHSRALLEPLALGSRDRTIIDPLVTALLRLGKIDAAKPYYATLASIGYREPRLTALWRQYINTSPSTGALDRRDHHD